MKLNKIKKIRNNYKIEIDDIEYETSEDVLIELKFLSSKEITEEEYELFLELNKKYEIYLNILKRVTRKMYSLAQVINLIKKETNDEEIIEFVISKLKNSNLINDNRYKEAYINDSVKLKKLGPKKIINDLKKDNITDISFNSETEDMINENLEKLVVKKINQNKTKSNYMLLMSLIQDLGMKGYETDKIKEIFNDFKKSEETIKENVRKKLISKYKNKYDKKDLEREVKNKLYQKGFK